MTKVTEGEIGTRQLLERIEEDGKRPTAGEGAGAKLLKSAVERAYKDRRA
jgi:hypothetical protein